MRSIRRTGSAAIGGLIFLALAALLVLSISAIASPPPSGPPPSIGGRSLTGQTPLCFGFLDACFYDDSVGYPPLPSFVVIWDTINDVEVARYAGGIGAPDYCDPAAAIPVPPTDPDGTIDDPLPLDDDGDPIPLPASGDDSGLGAGVFWDPDPSDVVDIYPVFAALDANSDPVCDYQWVELTTHWEVHCFSTDSTPVRTAVIRAD